MLRGMAGAQRGLLTAAQPVATGSGSRYAWLHVRCRGALRRVAIAAALALACVGGCSPAPAPCPRAPTALAAAPPPPSPSSHVASPAKTLPLTIVLHPDPAKHRVHVDITARGSSGTLATWSRSDSSAPIEGLRAEDAAGPLPSPSLDPSGRELKWPRTEQGTAAIHYDVVGQDKVRRVTHDVLVNWDIFLAPSESLLLLPSERTAGKVLVEIDAKDAYNVAGATLGIGNRFERRLSLQQLRHLTWIAGNLGNGTLNNFGEHDYGLWTPNPTFDPRGLFAEAASVRSMMGTFFGSPDHAPFCYLLISYRRGGGPVEAQRRVGGTLIGMDVGQRWDGHLRMAIAQQLVYHWIGEKLWVGPEDPAHEAESYWFVEGFARYYARELLFRSGLLDPAEYLDEMLGLADEQATNPDRNLGNTELAQLSARDVRAVAMLRARGALYATRIDAQIRKATKGKQRLDQVIIALLRAHRGSRATLAAKDFVQKLRADLGPEATRDFDRIIVRGQPVKLPPRALGPCFRTTRMKYRIERAGFDIAATLAAPDRKVVRLAADSPAAKAGLRADDVVMQIREPSKATRSQMQVVVLRDGKKVTIGFSRYVGSVWAQGWKRQRGVKDEQCAALAEPHA